MEKLQKLKCLNGLHLKLLAILTMTCDHAWACCVVQSAIFNHIGRLAFPIFAFLVAEGAAKTHDLTGYLKRMVLFAFLAEVPFDLMSGGTVFYPFHQNVLWTFTVALAVIWVSRRFERRTLQALIMLLGAVIGFLLGTILMVDYLGYGVLTVLVFYMCRGKRGGWLAELAAVAYINCVFLAGMEITVFGVDIPQQGLACLSLIPIFLYNGKRGYSSKALQIGFYAYYPAHILILALLGLYVM